MRYYTIRIFPESQYMTVIVTEFWKFRYNHLPMGICAPGDIFQAKVDTLLSDIEVVYTYINDILVLSRESFSKNTEQLITIFVRLRAEGLNVNSPKCSFGLKDIHYLGHVITREAIKPDPKKVQGIMDIWRPTNMTKAQ